MTTPSCPPSSSENCHFTCPNGGTWWVCPNEPRFVGCCASDPCTGTTTAPTCPDLYPASFDGAIFDEFVPNNCVDNPSSNWYTCNFTNPRFLGCCRSNPCANDGCPEEDLLPAAWSVRQPGQFELFLDQRGDDGGGDGGAGAGDAALSAGAIAGVVVGGVAGVAGVLAGLVLVLRWREKKRKRRTQGQGQPVVEHMPYQESDPHNPSPALTSKYPSGSSPPFSMSSPPLGSDGHRSVTVSEIDSTRTDYSHGLNIYGAPTGPHPIRELDGEPRLPEIHELEDRGR
ncbi:hypothetical protein BJX61DRAFT_552146 [Aspergillus egyptiacus]|nr:hypothetical protein BJX61DRAFT_552146 [Aspergillus egyptiacus]